MIVGKVDVEEILGSIFSDLQVNKYLFYLILGIFKCFLVNFKIDNKLQL